MTNRLWWMRAGLAGVLALAIGAPLSFAEDRCDRQIYGRHERASYQYNDRQYNDRTAYRYNNRGYVERAAYQDRNSGYQYGYPDTGYSVGNRNGDYYGYGDYPQQRSAGKSAAIIGGGAAAGAAVGAMTGGGKGAAIGAAVGALGGLVYDRATRNRYR